MATSKKKKGPKGRPAGLFTWLAIGLVIVVVAVLVIAKVSSGSSSATGGSSSFQATDATTVSQLTTVPQSALDTVGVTSSAVTASPPQAVKNLPAYSTSVNGKSLPTVLYVGAEYCPYCAAQRWATIIALSKFGTWSNIGNMTSSSKDIDPSTPTFTLAKATYTSKYLSFQSVEAYSNVPDAATNFYYPLQTPTKVQDKELATYDTSKYITALSSSQDGSIPFITFDNKFLTSGASYSPSVLQGLTRTQIATGLSDPTSPVTQAILASANYQIAAICSFTGNSAPVCSAKGTLTAKKAMGLA